MAYKACLKVHCKCPRHPRFNPEHGRGGVKAGCAVCDALCDLEAAMRTARLRAADAEQAAAVQVKLLEEGRRRKLSAACVA